MVSTFRRIDGGGDLPSDVQRAMGLGATAPAAAPLLTVALPTGDAVTLQDDGQIAIYRAIGYDYVLLSCQCQGEVINEIPRLAQYQIGFTVAGFTHRIYRFKNEYFTYTENKFIHFKNYPVASGDRPPSPFDPPPGLDHACETHTAPEFIPREYQEEADKQDLIPDRRREKKDE